MAVDRKFAQTGTTATLPTGSGALAGAPYAVGNIPVVLLTDALAASPYNATCQLDGIFDLPVQAESGAIVIGDILYWDSDETTKLTNESGGNIRWGYALEAIANGVTDTINCQVGY